MVFLHVLALLVLSLQTPLLAQDPETTVPSQEAASAAAVSGEATDSATAENAEPVRLDVSDIVEAAPVAAPAEGEAMISRHTFRRSLRITFRGRTRMRPSEYSTRRVPQSLPILSRESDHRAVTRGFLPRCR